PREPAPLGPGEPLPDRVAGFAPAGSGRLVRVDLAAAVLGGQLRGIKILSAVVLAVDTALLLLVLFFLHHLLAPWEMLLARAREVGPPGRGEEDETEFLLKTFERAVTALAAPERRVEDDIAAIERTLSQSLQSGLLLLGRQGEVLALNPIGAALLDV